MKLFQLWRHVVEASQRAVGNDVTQALHQQIGQKQIHFIASKWPVRCGSIQSIRLSQGRHCLKRVSCYSRDLEPSDCWDNAWSWIIAGLKHRYGCITTGSGSIEQDFRERVSNLQHKLNHHTRKRPIDRALEKFQLFLSNFSAHQSHCMRIDLLLRSCRHDHFMWYLLLLLTTVKL